jgi:serine protease Do/serine protease DegQ
VQITDLTPDLAKNLGISQSEGAIIQRVEKDSPGEKAGLKAGDVAIVLDGKPVKGSSDLRNRVGLSRLGSTVELTILRDGQKRDVRVKLEKIPEPQEVAAVEEREALSGASFVNPDSGDSTKGIIVKEVQRGSPAWLAGLRERDVVAAVNRRAVTNVSEFEKALKDGGRQVALSVRRGNEDLFLIIQ